MDLTVAIFVIVYVVIALGHLPGLRIDRTGAAVVGAMVLLALSEIAPAAAWASIDYSTVGLLFGFMVISSAFIVAGFYEFAALQVGGLKVGPHALLAILIVVGGGLSALLTNIVVAVAMTPVLAAITLSRRLNPVPFLLGFCFATSIGSAATLIGSPQNMIAAEALHISFSGFLQAAAPPTLAGLAIIWLVIVFAYQGRWQLADAPAAPAIAGAADATPPPMPFDLTETLKAAAVMVAVIAAFLLTDWPHMLVALAGASVLLVSRQIASQDMLRHVDGNLMLLLMGLFVVNAALEATGLPQQLIDGLRTVGLDLHDPLSMLIVMSGLSNFVGNTPAVMLVTPFIKGAAEPEALGAAIALSAGFSSTALVSGSLAGIIVVDQSRSRGITITLGEFARTGVPVALVTLALAAAWVWFL